MLHNQFRLASILQNKSKIWNFLFTCMSVYSYLHTFCVIMIIYSLLLIYTVFGSVALTYITADLLTFIPNYCRLTQNLVLQWDLGNAHCKMSCTWSHDIIGAPEVVCAHAAPPAGRKQKAILSLKKSPFHLMNASVKIREGFERGV